MPVLDPFAVDNWIRATLLATAGKTALVNGATVPADAVALVGDRIQPLRDDFAPEAWPCIVFRPASDSYFDNYAENNVLADGNYLVFMMMREDMLADAGWGGDIEAFARQGYIAISAALQGVSEHQAGGAGIIHGCEILTTWQRLYGEAGQRISEMGVIARIWST